MVAEDYEKQREELHQRWEVLYLFPVGGHMSLEEILLEEDHERMKSPRKEVHPYVVGQAELSLVVALMLLLELVVLLACRPLEQPYHQQEEASLLDLVLPVDLFPSGAHPWELVVPVVLDPLELAIRVALDPWELQAHPLHPEGPGWVHQLLVDL